ncbi:MAG TPA: DUF6056 family protein [Thermoanaerobaculia bacterium]|nr:DUF6056 family protein [Thermoanaerobaculia bacterium]
MIGDRAIGTATRILTAALLIALAVYAWRGWYVRYLRDDYCTAAAVRERGVVAAMLEHRQYWSGRYSYFLIKGTLESIGPATARVVPGLLLFAFAAAATWTIRRTIAVPPALAVLSGSAIAFAALDASPEMLSLVGPFFWETGVLTYMLPLILMTAWLGLFGAEGSVVLRSIAGALILLIAGGLSETSLAAQGALAGGVWIYALLRRDAGRSRIAASGVIATVVALALVATAPGNQTRLDVGLPRRSLAASLFDVLGRAYDFIGMQLFVDGEAVLVVMLAGALIAAGTRLRAATAAAFGAIAGGAYLASFAPAVVMSSGAPPFRALHIAMFFLTLTLGAFAAALFARAGAPGRRIAIAALLLATTIPVISAIATARTIPEIRRGAAEADRITRTLESAPGRDVTLLSRWGAVNEFASEDPGYWTNVCTCRYYGTRSLRLLRK